MSWSSRSCRDEAGQHRTHSNEDGSTAIVRATQHCKLAATHEVMLTGMLFGHQSGLEIGPCRDTKAGNCAGEIGAARGQVSPLEGESGLRNGGRRGGSSGGGARSNIFH